MASTRTVRKWARESGLDVSTGGPLPKAVWDAYDSAHPESDVEPLPPVAPTDDMPPETEETAPDTGGLKLGRVISNAKKTAKKKISDKTGRVSVAKPISHIWAMLAVPAKRASFPVGWMMTQQAPYAGYVLDDSVKNTIIDRMLQPFAKVEEGMKPIAGLMGPLVSAYLIDRFPDQMDRFIPMLRESLFMWAEVAGPYYNREEEVNTEFRKQYGSRVDEIIEQFKEVMLMVQAERAMQGG